MRASVLFATNAASVAGEIKKRFPVAVFLQRFGYLRMNERHDLRKRSFTFPPSVVNGVLVNLCRELVIAIFERYSDDGDILTQYIGDGSAVYPVVGLPQLDKESLLTIFDVPEKDRDNYFVKTLGVPVGISFEDTDETERHVEREGISIIYSGRTLKPIRTTRGLVFIESRYLSPVADVLDVLELYERRTAEGAPYIVAKAGFLLRAVIMPYDVINQQFVESLQSLTRECEFSLSEKERREREACDRFTFTEPEQCSLNVDPDTGEVVEESEVADE